MSKDFDDYIKSIEKPLMKNKHIKKKIFLQAIKSLDVFFRSYSFDNPELRANLIYYSQIYFRKLDDIVDGDERIVSQNYSFEDEKKYVLDFLNQRREYLLSNCMGTTDFELDILLKIILESSSKIGIDFKEEFIKLFRSLEFDAIRRGNISETQIIKSPQADIDQYFFRDYADSCGKCILKVVNGDTNDLDKMHNITFANRIYFNEIDIFQDISLGLINISAEDFIKYGISDEDILQIVSLSDTIKNINHLCKQKGFTDPAIKQYISAGLYNWLLDQLSLGLEYMNAWQHLSQVNSTKECLSDLLIKKQNPEDTILYFAYGLGTNGYFKKLSKHL